MKKLLFKKRTIPIALAAAGLVFLGTFVLHRLIEARIQETNVIAVRLKALEEKTGLIVRHGALRFEFLRGMVLTGVQISEKDARGQETILLSSAQAVLGFPLLAVSEPVPTSISIVSGHLHTRPFTTIKNPAERITALTRFFREAGVDLRASNLQLAELSEGQETASHDLRLHFSLLARDRDNASLRGELRFEDQPIIAFDTQWKESPQERIFLHVKAMPAHLAQTWSGGFLFLPESATISSGEVNGEGSMDLTGDGYAINLRGSFENLGIVGQGKDAFQARELQGEYEQMVVGTFAGGMLNSRLKLKSDLLEHTTAIDTDRTTRAIHYTLQGSLHLKPDSRLTLPAEIQAELDYDIGIEKKNLRDRQPITVTVDAQLKHLEMRLRDPWKSIPPIIIDRAVIKGSGPIGFAIPGHIGKTPFQFSGRIVPDLYRVGGETIFKHNSEFTLDFQQASIHDLVTGTVGISEDIVKFVNGPNAVRAEDSGPIWDNKFINDPFYKRFVEQAVIVGQVRIVHLTDTSPDMPASLSVRFRHRIPITEILVDSVTNDTTRLDGSYRIAYDAMLPQHSGKVELRYSGNGYRNRSLCDADTPVDPVALVDLRYNFQAEGIYLADLYFKSVTGLYLNVKHLPALTDYRVDLLRRLAELDHGGLRYIDLDVQRNSSGSLFKPIIVKAEDQDAALAGSGEFNVYEGGLLEFHYLLKKTARNGRFQVRIRPDSVWIPSS